MAPNICIKPDLATKQPNRLCKPLSRKENMKEHRVDYNKIAHLFDEPERDHSVDQNLLTFIIEHPETIFS